MTGWKGGVDHNQRPLNSTKKGTKMRGANRADGWAGDL